jgi:uncharacterized protein (TIGR00661 family)
MLLPPSFPSGQKILYCVLNWGMGHASRSIEVIDHLLLAQNNIEIASDGLPLELLRTRFPNILYHRLPSYNITYPTQSIFFNFIANAPNLWIASINENRFIKSLHIEKKYDLIISDNRPGCYIDGVRNVFITHQINPHHPFKMMQWFFKKINLHYIHKTQEVWIPDYSDQRLSGKLSNPTELKIPYYYLGPLSPYENLHQKKEYTTIVLTGPEPGRTELETQLYNEVKDQTNTKFIFIRGSKSVSNLKSSSNLIIKDFCDSKEMNEILNRTMLVISRSGYSTIMDIDRLQIPKKRLIPTPGQTEQEYLSELHS